MIAWAILPPRWFVRPRLTLAAGAAAVLLLAAENDRRALRAADHARTIVIAQAAGPDPERRERAGARALAMVRGRPEVTRARLVPPEELLDWLRQAGVSTAQDRWWLPTTIEAQLVHAADRVSITARLRAIPGISVTATGGTEAPIRPRWLLNWLASGTLLALAAGTERHALESTMLVLRQLGATPRERATALLLGVAGSVSVGALAGGIIASLGHTGSGTVLLWAVPAVMALPVAMLLPALRVAPAARP